MLTADLSMDEAVGDTLSHEHAAGVVPESATAKAVRGGGVRCNVLICSTDWQGCFLGSCGWRLAAWRAREHGDPYVPHRLLRSLVGAFASGNPQRK